jgi:hypothetical protein
MIKSVAMVNIKDYPNELPFCERWYLKHHSVEALGKDGPWMTRYISHRAVPAIPEAEPYGYYNYRVVEIWFRTLEERLNLPGGGVVFFHYPNHAERQGLKGPNLYETTWEGAPDYHPNISFIAPAAPTENFLGPTYFAEDKTILRWFIIVKYPDGVPVEEGEDWFLNVHSKEVAQQPGLTRYFSHKVVNVPGRSAQPWVRLIEQWYEDYKGWKKSVIDSPPKYTPPPWAKYHKYPFLKPYVDFCATFLLEHPTNDFLRENRPYQYI